jgi:M6 family metalloprotease-like protein
MLFVVRPVLRRGASGCLAAVLLGLAAAPAGATMPPREGVLPAVLREAFDRGAFAVPEGPHGTETSAGVRHWRLPIIRIAFSDSALYHSAGLLEQRLFDTTGAVPTGSMAEYYRWVSRGRMVVTGEVVATVVLPRTLGFYAADTFGVNLQGTPRNAYGLFRDAVVASDPTVDFSRYDLDNDGVVDMVWLVHAGPGGESTGNNDHLWSITSRAVGGWNNGSIVECDDLVAGSQLQHMRIDRFTILPELSGLRPGQLCEIGVFCHEFGHTLGLPDLYDTSVLGGARNVGPGNWALMATGSWGTNGLSPESPSHFGAWSALRLGWANLFRPAWDTTLVITPLADGGPVLEFTFQGEDTPDRFLIENRVRDGFDRQLPEEGLIVTQVDDAIVEAGLPANRVNAALVPGMRILEADGNYDLFWGWNRGDGTDPFPGRANRTRIDDLTSPWTRTFRGAPTNLALESIVKQGWDVSARVRVRATGWNPAQTIGSASGAPLESFGPAPRGAVAPTGLAWQVSSELLAGRQRAVVRERPWLAPWGPPVAFDRGFGAAIEPTLARIGNDDLAVAWIEVDGGPGRLLYRSRIRGVWTPPRLLTPETGGCSAPSIAVDDRGRVFLAWLEQTPEYRALRFMNFLYATPFGQARTLTLPIDVPSAPAITAAGDGRAYVLWSDVSQNRRVVVASRFHADSGMSQPVPLTSVTAAHQPAVAGVVDSAGTLHVVWQQSPSVGSEIHYQRRPRTGRLAPRDTTIDGEGDGLQNPRIALDPTGALHVVYERSTGSGQQVRYKRWHPVLGWDHRATEVSDADDLTVSSVEVLPTSSGNLTLAWIGFDGQGARLRERSRLLDGAGVTDAPPSAAAPNVALSALRNPVPAGDVLEFSGAALLPGSVLELMDASGRRVSETRAEVPGHAALGRERTRLLAPGLYFARVRGSAAVGRVVVLR